MATRSTLLYGAPERVISERAQEVNARHIMFGEPELEDNVFASVTSQVQAEGIQTLNVKSIR